MSSAHRDQGEGTKGGRWALLESTRLLELVGACAPPTTPESIAVVALPVTELDRLLERALVVRDSLQLLRQAGASGEAADRAQRAVDAAVLHCTGNAYAIDAGAASACVTLLHLVREAEVEVRLVDRDLSMDSCAMGLLESALPKRWLARLARLLAPLTEEYGDARDRYEFLVTRLLRLRGPSGFFLLPRQVVQSALDYVAPADHVTCSEQMRSAALLTLERHLKSVQALSSVEQLFRDGLYSEIYGYKLSLRGCIVDPDLLYAVATLNTAICERMHQEAAHVRTAEHLLQRISEAESRVRAAFGSQTRQGRARQQFLEARRQAQSQSLFRSATPRTQPAMGAVQPPDRRRISTWIVAGVTVLACLVLAAAAAPLIWDPSYRTTELQGRQLWTLSPLLQRGVLLESQLVFLGDVDPLRWDRLDDTMRRHDASLLRQALRARGVRVALLHRAGHVVCEIDARGEITLWPADGRGLPAG